MRVTPGQTITAQCLLNAVDDETLGPWIDVRGCTSLVFYQSSTGTTSGGAITFEEAAPSNLTASNPVVFGAGTGDYSAIGSASNASDTSAGKQKAIHPTAGAAYCFVRARVSTAISGGGSVSVVLVAS